MKKFLIISNRQYIKTRNKNFLYDNKINIKKIEKIKPKIIFFIFWSKKLNKRLFKKYNCIQFHTSDLPKFRGGSPIQNQIIRGIKKTKITAFKINSKIDGGDICLKKDINLSGNAKDIFENIERTAIKMIIKISKMKKIIFKKQIGKSSYFRRRKPKESNLEIVKFFNLSKIYDFIRMLDDEVYPNAFIKIADKKITFTNAKKSKKTISGTFRIQKN